MGSIDEISTLDNIVFYWCLVKSNDTGCNLEIFHEQKLRVTKTQYAAFH